MRAIPKNMFGIMGSNVSIMLVGNDLMYGDVPSIKLRLTQEKAKNPHNDITKPNPDSRTLFSQTP
jgi:hypothetical protein